MKLLSILFISAFSFFNEAEVPKCPNKISLISTREIGDKIEFQIEVSTTQSYTVTLYKGEGVLSPIKNFAGSGLRTFFFSEKKLTEGKYRVTVVFENETEFICKTRSLDIIKEFE